MTEFTTTKIGDRWFLVFEEGLLRVDEVAEIWTNYEAVPIKSGQVRTRSTLGGFEDVTPVKPKQLHDWGKFTTVGEHLSAFCIYCHANWPDGGECTGKPKQIPLMTLTGTYDTCTQCNSQIDIAYEDCPVCGNHESWHGDLLSKKLVISGITPDARECKHCGDPDTGLDRCSNCGWSLRKP